MKVKLAASYKVMEMMLDNNYDEDNKFNRKTNSFFFVLEGEWPLVQQIITYVTTTTSYDVTTTTSIYDVTQYDVITTFRPT